MNEAQVLNLSITYQHGGGRVVSASGSETSVSSSAPASTIIYDAYTSIIKKKLSQRVWLGNKSF